ncbi:MAG TPA: bacterial transcriptional activator domain-containing protein [Chthonomonadaceae bacterium]|nr:bacterial transcriptional activator domain-containing protein [Chthonomonadaceae bacterium]
MEPPGTPANAVLRADRFSVGLNPAAVTTDVLEFERALQQSAQADSAAERTQLLAQAADLYQERLLPGYYEDWIGIEQERLSGLFFEGVTRLITHLEARGDLSAALHYARRAVRADALREEAHKALMRLLAASGQPGAALRQYREMERLLHAGLGVEPSAPLRALARQIEQQTGLASPPIMAPVAVSRPLGPADAPAAAANAPVTRTFLMRDVSGSRARSTAKNANSC